MKDTIQTKPDPIQHFQKIKIVTIGDGSVGKTCIIAVYTSNKFPYGKIL